MGIPCSSCKKSLINFHSPLDPEQISKKDPKSLNPVKEREKKLFQLPQIHEKKLNNISREAVTAEISSKAKTQEDIDLILKALRGQFIFKTLDDDGQLAIVDLVKHYSLGSKEIVYKQGDPGVNFFCLAKGKLEVLSNGERTILGPGTGFGELALIDDRPRESTIKTMEPSVLWGIDRKSFNSGIKKLNSMNYEENKVFLSSISLFNMLTNNQKEALLSEFISLKWNCGQIIIKEGDSGDLFYLIKEGHVICYENAIEKRHLCKGEYFGEQSMLYNTLRTATVIAGSEVKVLTISRDSLYNVLGEKLEYILYHNSQLIAIDKSTTLRFLSHSQVNSLIKCSKIIRYNAGEVVIPRGSIKSEKLLMVLKGSIRGPLNDIGIYSCIGDKDIANKDNSCYGLDYVAIVDTDVAEIITQEFEAEIGGDISHVTLNNETNSMIIKVQILRGLSNEKIKSLIQALRFSHYDNKDVIIQQDTNGDSFYIIKSGMVKVYKNGIFIRDLTKYDYFGERELLSNDLRAATIVASGSVDCWVLNKNDFNDIINESIKKYLIRRIELQDITITLDDLIPIKTIGSGVFGNIILAIHKQKKTLFAIKALSRQKIQILDIYDNLISERKILMQSDHSMVIKLIKTHKDYNRIYFLMEYVWGKDLFEVLIELETVREDSAKFYIGCLLIIVEYLHERNIIHRDIKPENIMIDDEGYPKLIEFGTAKIVTGRTYTTVGTPHYMAPEVIMRSGYNTSADLWSVGIVLYEIVFGKVPFGNDDEDPKIIYEKIIEHRLDLKQNPYNGNIYKQFIQQLLSVNPSARLGGSMEKLKSHRWFRNFNWDRLISRQLKTPYVPIMKNDEPLIGNGSIQDYLFDLEETQTVFSRKASMMEPEGWDDEF